MCWLVRVALTLTDAHNVVLDWREGAVSAPCATVVKANCHKDKNQQELRVVPARGADQSQSAVTERVSVPLRADTSSARRRASAWGIAAVWFPTAQARAAAAASRRVQWHADPPGERP